MVRYLKEEKKQKEKNRFSSTKPAKPGGKCRLCQEQKERERERERDVRWHFRKNGGDERPWERRAVFLIFIKASFHNGWGERAGKKARRGDRERNNEANIKRKNAPSCAKGPPLTHLINTFIASVASVYRLSGSSDVTDATLSQHVAIKQNPGVAAK